MSAVWRCKEKIWQFLVECWHRPNNQTRHVWKRMSVKCTKNKNPRAKREKVLFLIAKYANLWRSCRYVVVVLAWKGYATVFLLFSRQNLTNTIPLLLLVGSLLPWTPEEDLRKLFYAKIYLRQILGQKLDQLELNWKTLGNFFKL